MRGVWIMRGLGGLLLLAAGLKMYGLAVEPIASTGWFLQPRVQTLIVEWELLLGMCLVLCLFLPYTWALTFATFTIFAAVTSWQLWIGQGSCGCLGRIRVHPALALTLDLCVLITLLLIRQSACQGSKLSLSESFSTLRLFFVGCCGVALMLGMLSWIGSMIFGTPQAALAAIRGDRLSLEPQVAHVGTGFSGEEKRITLQLQNWTDRPVFVYGGTSDCACIATESLPLRIQAGEIGQITVKVTIKGAAGLFTRYAVLYTDDPFVRMLRFRVTGTNLVDGQRPWLDRETGGRHWSFLEVRKCAM